MHDQHEHKFEIQPLQYKKKKMRLGDNATYTNHTLTFKNSLLYKNGRKISHKESVLKSFKCG